MKWDVGQPPIRNADVHDNDCRKGCAANVNAHDMLIESDLVEGDRGRGDAGSPDTTIRNNPISRNRSATSRSSRAASITVTLRLPTSRSTATASRATTTGSPEASRTGPTRATARLLTSFHVNDNTICGTGDGGQPTGVAADNGADLAHPGCQFQRQHHAVGPLRGIREGQQVPEAAAFESITELPPHAALRAILVVGISARACP